MLRLRTSDGFMLHNALLKEVEIEIGGQRIDKHYGHWMDTWNELSTPESKAKLYIMTGQIAADGTGVPSIKYSTAIANRRLLIANVEVCVPIYNGSKTPL